MQDDVRFQIDKWDEPAVNECAKRAKRLGIGWGNDTLSTYMDLCATHANGCPMDFKRLSEADDFNFVHDVGGIHRHLDRKTGQLMNHFLPRFTAKVSEPG